MVFIMYVYYYTNISKNLIMFLLLAYLIFKKIMKSFKRILLLDESNYLMTHTFNWIKNNFIFQTRFTIKKWSFPISIAGRRLWCYWVIGWEKWIIQLKFRTNSWLASLIEKLSLKTTSRNGASVIFPAILTIFHICDNFNILISIIC